MDAAFCSYLARIAPHYVAEMWPPVFAKGSGVRLTDSGGNEHIDLDGGWGALPLGHCHPELAEVTARAVHTLEHISPPSLPMVRLMERLLREIGDRGPSKFFFGVSGSETLEHALMICAAARPGKRRVLVMDRAYHGSTLGVLGLSFKNHPLTPLTPWQPVFAPTPHCYRCPFGLQSSTCDRACQTAVAELIATHHDELVAVVMEPVLGREGIVPPEGYLAHLEQVTRRHGVPLVFDEVKTGLGRCGHLFCHQEETQGSPEVLCLGKGLSSGFPLSLALVADTFLPSDFMTRYLLLQTTFSGHAVACARAERTIDLVISLDLPSRARRAGERLRQVLREALADFPGLGEVRGKGLLCALEFVTDPESRRPSAAALDRFLTVARTAGLHLETVFHNVVVLTPPLIIADADIDEVGARLREGMKR